MPHSTASVVGALTKAGGEAREEAGARARGCGDVDEARQALCKARGVGIPAQLHARADARTPATSRCTHTANHKRVSGNTDGRGLHMPEPEVEVRLQAQVEQRPGMVGVRTELVKRRVTIAHVSVTYLVHHLMLKLAVAHGCAADCDAIGLAGHHRRPRASLHIGALVDVAGADGRPHGCAVRAAREVIQRREARQLAGRALEIEGRPDACEEAGDGCEHHMRRAFSIAIVHEEARQATPWPQLLIQRHAAAARSSRAA
eukprot:741249-Prymnesium_polylepis.1